jgi:hypothetical protein
LGSEGGDLRASQASLTVCGSHFNESYANEGGSLYLKNTHAVIQCSTFYNTSQSAGTGGGAVSALGASNVTVRDCSFWYNYAEAGAGIYAQDAVLRVTGSKFLHTFGSAIYTDAAELTVQHTGFHNCSSPYGGAVRVAFSSPESREAIFRNVTIADCLATSNGGGIQAELLGSDSDGSVSIVDSTISGCEVSRSPQP